MVSCGISSLSGTLVGPGGFRGGCRCGSSASTTAQISCLSPVPKRLFVERGLLEMVGCLGTGETMSLNSSAGLLLSLITKRCISAVSL